MRLLLLNVPGATSYTDLKTNENIDTFQACAIQKGLLSDDKTWDNTLVEASSFTTVSNKLRILFAMILAKCNPYFPYYFLYNERLTESRNV